MDLPHSSGIYKIENRCNGKCYIGQSLDIHRRVNRHLNDLHNNKHYNGHLQDAWNKYGSDNFDVCIVELCDRSVLSEKEIKYIQEYGSYVNGYNLTTGGEGTSGYLLTEEDIEKLKLSLKHTWHRVVLLNTREVFECISDAHLAYGVDETSIGLCCKNLRISAGSYNNQRLAWVYYDDYIEMTEQDISSKITRAQRNKSGANSACSKAVVLLNTGAVFDGVNEACREYGISVSLMSRVCNGRGKSCGTINGERLVWRYLETYKNMSKEDIRQLIVDANSAMRGERHFGAKSVLLVNTGEVFPCMSDAARKFGLTLKGISACCTGNKKSSGVLDGEKMVWRYA